MDDGSNITKVKRHPAKVVGKLEYRRPLKVLTKFKENWDVVKTSLAKLKRKFFLQWPLGMTHLLVNCNLTDTWGQMPNAESRS